MRNERLRVAMASRGWTTGQMAEMVGVDAKTAERWVNTGRTPHRTTAIRAAEMLGEDVTFLWPTLRQSRPARVIHPELITLYSRRADAPADLWVNLFSQASQRIDILVYAAVFLHEQRPELNELLATRGSAGCRVRVALGDPDSAAVRQRGHEERFGHGIESRCRLALLHYRPLIGARGVEIRQHDTTLYNSIYRADDEMLVNAHMFGINAYSTPLWHLRRVEGGCLFDGYARSFEDVWAVSKPVEG